MQHASEHEEKLSAVGHELDAATHVLTEATAKLAAAKRARAGLSPSASDKEIRRCRDDEEVAAERVALSTRARDVVAQRFRNLEHDMRYAVDADNEAAIDLRLETMRAAVREARALRWKADAIDRDLIGPLFDEYTDLADLRGRPIDHKIDAPENRPRDLHDLYFSTARLDGFDVPTLWEQSPLGALYIEAQRRNEAWTRADIARTARSVVVDEPKPVDPHPWRAAPPPTPPTENPLFTFDLDSEGTSP